jgi:hypothetical protein
MMMMMKAGSKEEHLCYIVAVMNDFNGYECEVAIYYVWRIPINLFLTKKKHFSNLCSAILRKLPPTLPAGMSNAKHHSCVFSFIVVNLVPL